MYQRSPSLIFDKRNSLWHNLLCCVPFFGKGAPDVAYDLSRFKNHATLRNNPSYIVGDKLGIQVPDFIPASSQNGKIPRGIFTWDGIVTLHFWFYLDALPGGDTGLFDNQWGNDNSGGFQILIQGSGGNMVSYAGDLTGRQSIGNGGITTGKWFCYILEADAINDTLTVWLNNEQAAQNTGFTKNTVDGGTTNAGSYRFFANSQENNYLDGKGFNVMLWDRRLTPSERLFLYSKPFGMYVVNPLRRSYGYVPVTITPVSLSDSGAGTEILNLLNQIPVVDSGSASELLDILVQLVLSDTGTLSNETITAVIAITLSDSAIASEVVDLLVLLLLTDTGSANEVTSFLVSLALSDTAIGTDALVVLAILSILDSGVDSEIASYIQLNNLSETGTGTELLSLINSFLLTDTGTANESTDILVNFLVSDSVVATEALSLLAQIALADNALGTDLITIVTALSLSDTGIATELLQIIVSNSVSDTGNSSEALSLLTQILLSDSGLSNEALSLLVSLAVKDNAVGNDALFILMSIAVSDTATGTDVLSVLLVLGLYERGVGLFNNGGNLYNRTSGGLYNKSS